MAMVDLRQEFHHELEAIEANVIELFGMVAEDVPRATDALLSGNSQEARALAERDRAIDDLYPKIEDLADRELVLQQPLASDLRFLVSVLRVVPELERSHDLVVNIARRASYILSEDLSPRTRRLVEQMGNLASDLWCEAVDCWRQRDRRRAGQRRLVRREAAHWRGDPSGFSRIPIARCAVRAPQLLVCSRSPSSPSAHHAHPQRPRAESPGTGRPWAAGPARYGGLGHRPPVAYMGPSALGVTPQGLADS